MKVKIPKAFYNDRLERELPCPVIIQETGSHYTISLDSTCTDFLDDADYYAHRDGPDEVSIGLKSSARATAKAIRRGNLHP